MPKGRARCFPEGKEANCVTAAIGPTAISPYKSEANAVALQYYTHQNDSSIGIHCQQIQTFRVILTAGIANGSKIPMDFSAA